MKKSIPFFLCSLLLTSFVTVGCDNENSTNSSSNSKGLIPGENRTAWFEWFDNINDAANFIVNLKMLNKTMILILALLSLIY